MQEDTAAPTRAVITLTLKRTIIMGSINKTAALIVVCVFSLTSAYSQKDPDPVLYHQYAEKKYSAYDYIQIVEKVGWKPMNANISLKDFEDVFIEVSQRSGALQSMAMDGCYYCALNRDFLFDRYNKTYKPVSQETWNEYCPVLYVFMTSDKRK